MVQTSFNTSGQHKSKIYNQHTNIAGCRGVVRLGGQVFRFYRGVPPRWGLVIFDFYFLHFDAKKYEKEDFNQQRAHQLKHNNCLKHYKVTFGAYICFVLYKSVS